MKKTVFLFALTAFALTAHAQTASIVGNWLMIKAETNGNVQEPYFITVFKKDGKMQVMDMIAGTWKFDEKNNTLIMQSKMDKDFNGTAKILKLTADALVINKDGARYTYSRVHPEAIAKANNMSGLSGDWKLLGTDYPTALLKFELPDAFTLLQAADGETDTARGTWIFNPEEETIIFMGFSHLLRGKIKVTDLSNDAFTLKLADRTLKAQRIKASANKIERLTFKEEDFPEEQQESHYQLPWTDFDAMVQFLSTVKSIQYKYGKLVEEFNTLIYTSTILSKIKANVQKPSVEFTNLSISESDTMQFSQNVKGGLMGQYNAFFPKDEPWPYRIIGIETVTVPAGTFQCTVIEGFDTETKIKYWMINDMPGLYAKIIKEEIDPFDKLDYKLLELEKIN